MMSAYVQVIPISQKLRLQTALTAYFRQFDRCKSSNENQYPYKIVSGRPLWLWTIHPLAA